MNKGDIQNKIYDQTETLKDALAILDAAVEQFDAYEKYKPENTAVFGLVQDINNLRRLVRVANMLLTPSIGKLVTLEEEIEKDCQTANVAVEGGVA